MKKRKRHSAGQIVKKLRDADAMLAAGKTVCEVVQSLEVSEATLSRWRTQYGGVKSEEAKRLKKLEEENARLSKIIGDQVLDITMLQMHIPRDSSVPPSSEHLYNAKPKEYRQETMAGRPGRTQAASTRAGARRGLHQRHAVLSRWLPTLWRSAPARL